MDSEGSSSGLPGSDNQDSNEPAPPGTTPSNLNKSPSTPLLKLLPSSKGVENAKKRLRAFSIQKKAPITPVSLSKPSASGSTVLIGKLSSAKPSTPKVEDDSKKLPKPPKPGAARKNIQDSYTELQKRTLAEIEDMKRKMELVDLGIPLGLICPSANSDKAMPTKAMPPIKTFLDPSKVDEIIRDAKKAKAEGRKFKFDYQKILPDYDNPFQRKREETQGKDESAEKEQRHKSPHYLKTAKGGRLIDRIRDKAKKKSEKYDSSRRHSEKYDRSRKDDRDKDKYKERRSKDKDAKKDVETPKSVKSGENPAEPDAKETDVNLNDYLVCDSWSLDNDDKTSSPQVQDKSNKATTSKEGNKERINKDSKVASKDAIKIKEELEKEALLKAVEDPNPAIKIEKLQPVIDSFEFEIDPNDDDILMFDEDSKQHVKPKQSFDYNQDTNMSDSLADDNFLESVINEIKQENLSDDDSQDKGLVEYDSPIGDFKGQGTPELDDSMRHIDSQRSDYSDGWRSTDSGCKSTESGYRSTESGSRSVESAYRSEERKKNKDRKNRQKSSEEYSSERDKEQEKDRRDMSAEENMATGISTATLESLEMWDFVLKICQPLLFRHDKTKCYRQTRTEPVVWWATRPGSCSCVRGRGVVLGELRARRPPLVDRLYGTDQIPDDAPPPKRQWYPPGERSLAETVTMLHNVAVTQSVTALQNTGVCDDTPRQDSLMLDREYQRFMEAVWPDVADAQAPSRSTTPVRQETEKADKKKSKGDEKKIKLSSEGWSQESDVEEEVEKSSKKQKGEGKLKEKSRKRKRSTSTLSSTTDDDDAKRKKSKKKANKKIKTKLAKKRRTEKKYLKKLKDKQKKKKLIKAEDEEEEAPKKKSKDKKLKKKQQKLKKIQKKKKSRPKSSSSSSSSSSDSSDSDERTKKRKKNKKNKEDAFDVNILNNIKTEKLTDDEKNQNMTDFSPRRQQERRKEIIDVKEFDLGIQIKQEVEDRPDEKMDDFDLGNNDFVEDSHVEKDTFKDPERLTPQRHDENLSQCSSQESQCSEKPPSYEKDESHLRPSSQNSNYSFNDVIASQSAYKMEGEEKFEYEQENYEMYEHLAMAYQSDVASNQVPLPIEEGTQQIQTVVRLRGEIKCDWRAGADKPAPAHNNARPSRWGLKPGEVNIVLTGGTEQYPAEPVYRIESIANRNDNSSGSYDEAYMDTYGAMDRLQYGDCFSAADAQSQLQQSQRQSQQSHSQKSQDKERRGTLDARIDQALRSSVLGDIAMEPENKETEAERDKREGGILVVSGVSRGVKRVSFADGYKPGQDSDTEEPPAKKTKRPRRRGCAWPCPESHPDHVPLWDALPPPRAPPGSPPPARPAAPPLHLLRQHKPPPLHLLQHHKPPPLGMHPPTMEHKFDPTMPMANFMPPEPPPGVITFQ